MQIGGNRSHEIPYDRFRDECLFVKQRCCSTVRNVRVNMLRERQEQTTVLSHATFSTFGTEDTTGHNNRSLAGASRTFREVELLPCRGDGDVVLSAGPTAAPCVGAGGVAVACATSAAPHCSPSEWARIIGEYHRLTWGKAYQRRVTQNYWTQGDMFVGGNYVAAVRRRLT